MRCRGLLAAMFFALILDASPTLSEETITQKVSAIKDALVTLCLAGGSQTDITAKGDVELSSQIKDILTGKIGGKIIGKADFKKTTWEGIVGGISKEMTANESQEADSARECMVDNGFLLISKALSNQ
jgi:hypothetical protein